MKDQVDDRMRYRKLFSIQKMSTLLRNCCILMVIVFFPSPSFSGVLFEERLSYSVAKGDTLSTVGAYFGTDLKRLARENNLDPSTPLKAGRKLRISTTKIIPETMQNGILIDVPGRMLYFFEGGAPIMAFPVGLGMPKGEGEKGWETPSGKFTIKGKLKSPDWKVPKSIQEEMKREGLAVKESYPPGPKNPVGGYVLLTTLPGILIHETIDPLSINKYLSHGCVRVMRDDMEQLFDSSGAGVSGEIVYAPIKLASRSDGRVFMEVNKDIYENVKDIQAEARRLIEKAGLLDSVDMNKVVKIVQEQKGIPEEITVK